MRRWNAKTVFRGSARACCLASSPTRGSPFAVKHTIEGVRRDPSWFGITRGAPPSMTPTHELVVPRSIPISLPTSNPSSQAVLECPLVYAFGQVRARKAVAGFEFLDDRLRLEE